MNIYSHFEKLKNTIKLGDSKRTLLEIIASWEALAERIVAFIRNREAVKYLVVTIPEALGVRLTERMIKELEENSLTVENIIINNVVKDEDCEFHKVRRKMQERYIQLIQDVYGEKNIMLLHLSPYEIKGPERIAEVAKKLFQ